MLNFIKNEPVRLYAAATAVITLVAHFYPSVPVALVLGLVAAVLGLGETVRANVSPTNQLPQSTSPEGDAAP